jgi:hypothetical protein
METLSIVHLNKERIETYIKWYEQKLPFICDSLLSQDFCHMIEYWKNIDCSKEYKIIKQSDNKEHLFVEGLDYYIPEYFVEK